MGENLASPFVKHLEHDVQLISGFIALDGSSNVIGVAPVAASTPVGAGPYSMCKGLLGNVGFAGAVVYQPHISAGLYTFVLDKAWMALLDARVTLLDQGLVTGIQPSVKANVRATTSVGANGGYPNGADPGTDPTIAAQNVQVRFRASIAGGALVDPVASTGFWLSLLLKRTAVR
jgi:hypothetical protein